MSRRMQSSSRYKDGMHSLSLFTADKSLAAGELSAESVSCFLSVCSSSGPAESVLHFFVRWIKTSITAYIASVSG